MNDLDQFRNGLSWMQAQCHQLAIDKGWYDQERNPIELIGLIVSELGEATESIREEAMSKKIIGYTGKQEEMSDVIIRIMDYAGYRGLNLSECTTEMLGYLRRYSEEEIKISFALIKIMGLTSGDDPISDSVIAKHEYNKSRPQRHGGKKY